MLRRDWPLLLVLSVLALAGRAAVIAVRTSELTQDRDAYLAIAEGLHAGRGYSSPGSDSPTAYRPPLYPLVLAIAPTEAIGTWVATVNLASGVATVWFTFAIGLGLGLPRWGAAVTAGLTAIDPLLLRYSSQPMTESLCTLLVTVWLWRMLRFQQHPSVGTAGRCGVWFGLCALCRPTVWSAVALIAVWAAWRWHRSAAATLSKLPASVPDTSSVGTEPSLPGIANACSIAIATALGCALVVAPWLVRNWLVMGTPILTTTHGGYTLLLANNRSFYDEVVQQPWGTPWDGSHGLGQEAWFRSEQALMRNDGVSTEVAADAWMNRRARSEIANDPTAFLQACGLRAAWFWNIAPLSEGRAGWPAWVIALTAVFYTAMWLTAAAGALDVVLTRSPTWIPGLLLIASFSALHLVYWSNARMRAPLVPILALLAARGLIVIRSRFAA